MAEEIVYAAPYKFYARLIAGSGVVYACGVQLRHYNDSRRHREQRGAAEQQIIQSAAFLVGNVNVYSAHHKQHRAEQQSAARAGHDHCDVHKGRADKIEIAALCEDAYRGYYHEKYARDEVALLEKQHSALFEEFFKVLNVKAENNYHKQQSARVQYPRNTLKAVVIALVFKAGAEYKIQGKLSEAESERIVQTHRSEVILWRYNSRAAEDERRRNGDIWICEFAENYLSAVINEVKDKRKRKRNDCIPHVLREDGKILVVRHRSEKREHNRWHYGQQIVREYHDDNAQKHIKEHALERSVAENRRALGKQQHRQIVFAAPHCADRALAFLEK